MGMAQPVDWLAIAPPLLVVLVAVAVLFVPARARSATAVGGVLLASGSLLALAFSLSAGGGALETVRRQAFCTPDGCSYQVNALTLVVQLLVLAGTLVVLLMSASSRREGEYHFLLLASAAGALSIAAGRDLITIAVALELVTLPAIAVVGLRSEGRAAESTVKFFLFSVVSSAIMLFGIGLVYGVSGSVQLEAIGERLAQAHPGVAAVAGVLTLVGFGFKVGAVPFHFWVPDTYVGAPVPVAAYLSVVSKTAGLVALISVVGLGFGDGLAGWPVLLGWIAVLTMTVGNVVALRQSTPVRLLAWSNIAQVGFVLLPLGAMATGREQVLGASLAYLVIYAVFNLGAFAVVGVVSGAEPTRAPVGRDGAAGLEAYRGLFHRQRWLALALAFFLLGLAGLPPGIAGLFGKVVVIQAAVRGEAVWLAVLAAINVAIGLAYYLRWTALLFQDGEPSAERPSPDRAGVVAVGLLLVAGLALSVAPGLALRLVVLTP